MNPVIQLPTIAELCRFLGIQAQHPLVAVVDFGRMDERFADDIRISAGFYSLMFKNYGCSHVRYGRQALDFTDGSLICIAPNQVLTISNDGGDAPTTREGWGLFFHPELLHGSALASGIDRYTFFDYEVSEALHLSDKEKLILNDGIAKIVSELNENIDGYSQSLIVSNIELLLNYCMRFYGRQFITRQSVNSGVVTDIERYLKQHFRQTGELGSLPTVKGLAERVHLSPGYLGDLVKKETGRSAQDLIHLHLIEEAKLRLRSSDQAVNEIAYALGFEYPQYFSKLFKKKTGETPASYRLLN